jgi:hypothetical protein
LRSWRRGDGRSNWQLARKIWRRWARLSARGRSRRAGSSGRGCCWPTGKTRRFLRSVGRSGCIIRPSSAASSAPWGKDPMAALDDRPRPGREPTITLEAKAWLVSLACRKAKDLGYPHESWTTRLLARHAREHGPAQGHTCLAKLEGRTFGYALELLWPPAPAPTAPSCRLAPAACWRRRQLRCSARIATATDLSAASQRPSYAVRRPPPRGSVGARPPRGLFSSALGIQVVHPGPRPWRSAERLPPA